MPLKVLPTDPRQLFPVSQALRGLEDELTVGQREAAYHLAARIQGKPSNGRASYLPHHVKQAVMDNLCMSQPFAEDNR